MKKTLVPLLSIALLSTTILGGGTVFAATSATQGETPVSAELTLPADKDVTPPTVTNPNPDPDPNNPYPGVVPPTVSQQNGRGIVYYPGAQSVKAELQNSGEQEIKLQSKIHVGVKDKLRKKDEWTLTATLNWTGSNSNELSGTTIKGDKGIVQENVDGAGTLTNITNDVVTTSAQSLTINETPTAIMETSNNIMKDGVYDYSVENFRINIPEASTVPAGTYTGMIDWNLAITP